MKITVENNQISKLCVRNFRYVAIELDDNIPEAKKFASISNFKIQFYFLTLQKVVLVLELNSNIKINKINFNIEITKKLL